MDKVKTVALVAHDNRISDLTEWVAFNADKLAKHHLVCTGANGEMVEETLQKKRDIGPGSQYCTMSLRPVTVPRLTS